jgi:very-short-patch-repair endonuclease
MSRGRSYRARPTGYSNRRSATVRSRPYRPRRELRPWVRTLGHLIAGAVRWVVGLLLGKSSAAPMRPVPAPPVSPRPQAVRPSHWPPQLRADPSLAVPAAVPEQLPYRRRSHLLSQGERAVWYPLYYAVKGRYRLFCKARLADVVTYPRGRWFKRIRGYHVDFVVCDPATTAPLLVVELDDRSHRSVEAQERDRFKDEVLAAAGVPILRVRAQQAYDPVELREAIEQRLRPE